MGHLKSKSTYDILRMHGVDRRAFLKFCAVTTAAMGLDATMIPQIVNALENKPAASMPHRSFPLRKIPK